VGVAGTRKVNKAPARLLKRVVEKRRHWEGLQTLQELRFPKRMKEVYEKVAGEAVWRCKAGGTFPEGLIKQVAAARVAQSRAVTERLSRRQGHVLAVPETRQVAAETTVGGGEDTEGAAPEEGAAGGRASEGAVETQGEEQMVWTVLDEDWRAVRGDVLVRGLEEMGLQVEVDGAVGDPHLSTELRRLDRERGYWGVVLHNSSSGEVAAACVVFEGRRRVKKRVIQVTAMAVRQGYRKRGLARQTMQRVQARIGEEVARTGGGKSGESTDGGYSLVAGLKHCMQSEGIGLYKALGWRGTGES
jgi:hypothetical protein